MPPSQNPSKLSNILVLGAGSFGSCLADHLGDSDHHVFMWSRSQHIVDYFNKHHRNPQFLQDHEFSHHITAVGPEFPNEDLLKKMDVLLFAIPTEGVRETLILLHHKLDLNHLPLLIFVNKGIEISTQSLTLEIIADVCGPEIARLATFISGPSFAKEIVRRQPTSVSVASLTDAEAQKASQVFHQPWFRCYTSDDPIGIELAGAMKNVYAIVTGAADGLGFENNTRASLITRALYEMTKLGTVYGANPLTFLGLAGVGDLMLTCTSSMSRNYTVGRRLAGGETLEHIIDTLGSVAEGVQTSRGLKSLVDDLGISLPIANTVYEVLYEGLTQCNRILCTKADVHALGKDVRERAHYLMSLPPVPELDLPDEIAGKPGRRLMQKLGLL